MTQPIQPNQEFCFCTLALGEKYRVLAKQLAADIEKYSRGTFLVVGTDKPKDFADCPNAIAFEHHKQGLLHCFHDRRFVIQHALSKFRVAIHIDADTRFLAPVPDTFKWPAGITGRQENLIEHIKKYCSERLPFITDVARKLNIPLDHAKFIGESLYIVTRDKGKEVEFIKTWGIIASYLELKGIHAGDGNAMGLAAAKVGWEVNSEGWKTLRNITKHSDAFSENKKLTFWGQLKRRLHYHYRLNKARLAALKNFDFYYR